LAAINIPRKRLAHFEAVKGIIAAKIKKKPREMYPRILKGSLLRNIICLSKGI
jgi:hypothetical protein